MTKQEVLASVFIHYGSSNFDTKQFNHVTKKDINTKPRTGGLWASIDGKDGGWEAWCEAENYDKYNHGERTSFKFILKPDTKLLYIDNPILLDDYIVKRHKFFINQSVNWYKVSKKFDAVYFDLTKCPALYMTFYGVDCDSICVFNPNCIEEVVD